MQAQQGRRRPTPAFPHPQQPINPYGAPALSEPDGRAQRWRVPEDEEHTTTGIEIEGEATPVLAPVDGHTPVAPPGGAIQDLRDEVIAAGLDTRRLTVAAGETGVVRVALLNNGDRHARFHIHVEGWVDEEWVRILRGDQEDTGTPTLQIWLHPAERTLLTIAITPPRTPESRAGERPFAVIIRTSDYGSRQCRLGAHLTIQPYHDLLLGEVAPRRSVTSWRRRTVRMVLPVTNRGNGAAEIFVQGRAAQRRSEVDLLAPGARGWRPRRVTLSLAPGKTARIGLRVTPPAPPLIGLRRRTAQVGLAIGYLNAAATPLSATATVTSRPLIGPWLLATLCGLCGLVVIGAFLLTTVTATLAARRAPAPVAAVTQPTPVPPQMITIVVHLAQPALASTTFARTPGASDGAAPSFPVIDPVIDPAIAANAPIVRPDQVTAPGAPYQASTFRPVEALAQAPPEPRPAQARFTYQQMFQEIGLQYDLNWRMLAAQAYLESSFDALALSNSGAMGLMQIVPGTWREWAPAVAANDPFDAYSSTLVAAVYLDYLRGELGKRGHPQTEWMLVAYNWGIDRLIEHLEAGRTWEDLPPGRRHYAEEILRIAQTIPLD
jgi:membrane-bound lytic murein transglycosylase F